MPFGIDPSQVVDAEVVGNAPTYSKFVSHSDVQVAPNGQVQVNVSIPTPSELALIEQRARALSAYVKLPFFSLVALNGRVPLIFRLGAGLLAILEATQLARDAGYDYQNLEQW